MNSSLVWISIRSFGLITVVIHFVRSISNNKGRNWFDLQSISHSWKWYSTPKKSWIGNLRFTGVGHTTVSPVPYTLTYITTRQLPDSIGVPTKLVIEKTRLGRRCARVQRAAVRPFRAVAAREHDCRDANKLLYYYLLLLFSSSSFPNTRPGR